VRPPDPEHEKLLCNLFAEVIGVSRVGVDDNFFDLGGNSLDAVLLVYRIRSALNSDMSLLDLFAHPKVAEIANLIAQENGAGTSCP
jgi:acyl carrier protein